MSDPQPPQQPEPSSPEAIDPSELKEAEEYLGRDNFIKLHKSQFKAMGLPPSLMNQVYDKLLKEQFDAMEAFQVEYVEEEGFRVVCNKEGGLKAGKDVWLLDHLWTTSIAKGPQQLREIDGLVDRLWTLADMDRHLEEERQEKAAAKAQKAAPSAAAAAPAAAPTDDSSSSESVADPDEDTLSQIMAAASVSREQATQAFKAHKGDLVQTIISFEGMTEREKELRKDMEQMLEKQAEEQLKAKGTLQEEEEEEQVENSEDMSLERKAELLWPALFKHGLVGSYFTTLLSDVSSSQLKQEDVQTTLYVNDEVGSSFGQTVQEGNVNAELHPLVCVTLGGVAFSLLWLTKDVEEGEEIVIFNRPPIRLPGH